MKHPKYAHSFEVFYELPEPLRELKRLAYNFRWTWHHETQELFREMDRTLWSEVEHNPVQLLNRISRERLERLSEDQMFLNDLAFAVEDLDRYLAAETWFDRQYPGEREKTLIAYFCAEFGISEALPIYSGGLGVLAGDHLKAASDLGLPLVGVGLLYSRGYFRQVMTPDGWQQEVYPQYDFYNMPLTLVRGEDQQPIRVEIQLPERDIVCQVWRADVGRVPLYLLDSNVLENAPVDQEITDTLYGGDQEMRIRQEMSLGVGGLRALRAVGLNPTVCHMNEGHAGFLVLERIRQFMKENGCEFRVARKVVVSGNCFTTHTPVPAGFDLFTADMVDRYTKRIYEPMGIGAKDVIRLGRIDDDNEGEAFNMAVLAMENSNHVNGVSKLHAEVSRAMFHSKWPHYPEDEVPIESVTNGVHTMTWVSRRFAQLFDTYLGLDWRRNPEDPKAWEKVWDIPDIALWEARENQRGDMIRYVRRRLHQQLERQGVSRTEIGAVEQILDPRYLTVGFARRFATYKRATLMLADRERLKKILNHPERPVQIILAGKSHPKDEPGKRMIQELINFIRNEGARARMVFLEDYDMAIARALVQGVDVWLNNPRRPYEASGTSGMKVVPNGGLNCSVLDGWWNEAYRPGVGWAIGERREYGDPGHQDWIESLSLYHILETEIAPKYYNRFNGEAPDAWVDMMKASISELAPIYCTGRMVQEYASRFYMPASKAYQALSAEGLQRAKDALAWRDRTRAEWGKVRIVRVSDTAPTRAKIGTEFDVEVFVDLGPLKPDEVRVQALVGHVGLNRELQDIEIYDLHPVEAPSGPVKFSGTVRCLKPGHWGYTVRVVPYHKDVHIAHELAMVTWEDAQR